MSRGYYTPSITQVLSLNQRDVKSPSEEVSTDPDYFRGPNPKIIKLGEETFPIFSVLPGPDPANE